METIGLEERTAQWMDAVENGEGLFVIRGAGGSGKTAFLQTLTQRLKKQRSAAVVSVVCGGELLTVRELLVEMVRQLEGLLGSKEPFGGAGEGNPLAGRSISHGLEDWYFTMDSRHPKATPSPAAWRDEFYRLLVELADKRPITLLVDGLERLAWEQWNERAYWLPRELPPGVRVVLTCRDSFPLHIEADIFDTVGDYTLPPLSEEVATSIRAGLEKILEDRSLEERRALLMLTIGGEALDWEDLERLLAPMGLVRARESTAGCLERLVGPVPFLELAGSAVGVQKGFLRDCYLALHSSREVEEGEAALYRCLAKSKRPGLICEPEFLRLCFSTGHGAEFRNNIGSYGKGSEEAAAGLLRRMMLGDERVADQLVRLTEEDPFVWSRDRRWERVSSWMRFLTDRLLPGLHWKSSGAEYGLFCRLTDGMLASIDGGGTLQKRLEKGWDSKAEAIRRDIGFFGYLSQTIVFDEARWSGLHDRYMEALAIAWKLVELEPGNREHFCKAKEMLRHTLLAPVMVTAHWTQWAALMNGVTAYVGSEKEEDRFLCAQCYHLVAAAYNQLGERALTLEYEQKAVGLLEGLMRWPKPQYQMALAECLGLLAIEMARQEDPKARVYLNQAQILLEPLAGQEERATELLAWLYELSAEVFKLEASLLDAVDLIQKARILYYDLYHSHAMGYYRRRMAECWRSQTEIVYELYQVFPVMKTYLENALQYARKAMEWYGETPPTTDDSFLELMAVMVGDANTEDQEMGIVYSFCNEAVNFCDLVMAKRDEDSGPLEFAAAQLYHMMAYFFAEGQWPERAAELCRTAKELLEKSEEPIYEEAREALLSQIEGSIERYDNWTV